ncbi:transcriptional corepressor LEUNIG_HOMOLOG-like isoform X1 [Cynara cardunculus var. scolymus]|uniref:transcriptional corepressor LEUNIG_HOMOLOG-like isoform X1 n=1 Tax=Cynara cardunculus var. scolymus TaxID=59895 RepID=UPI000D624249|nr:transcriptional corepressor LEUNIG_HOMOLOG-like isoform X1 [Cynara cardunculus var. scolymus]XP_024981909.1 transcriptional corepressor LEUNIG_HOMOLOG-like isoform X1 [Cynara cardunculus var. scolymus]XP_024981910.1 transcriptional corepressor LEUNIG_HOMOLOG-like isoform X1 [Cynara cardunculus var. scolymus]XP_024981911.1 transcriptional corepressor LEUNIG_HOMOLOG-like isoform X1 [Cynara cardunculus var. scolymus]XP_024981912.1 transcriptional corepressor LEUNIG_HOMOLOG-like isoform X1 [Cyna
MAQNWEADKMLDVYIHDYLLKRKMHASAKAFMTEGKVATDPVAIDAPGGFLLEWWSVFWDIFIARTNEKHSEAAAAYIETQQMKAKEHQQQLQMQQLHLMQQRNVHLQRRDPNHPPLGGSVNPMNTDGMMGKPSASTMGVKMQEEPMKHSHSMVSETSPALLDASRMTLLKPANNHQGLLIPGNSPNVSSTLQQIQGRPQLNTEIKQEVNLGNTQKSLPTDPSSIYGQVLQSKSGLGGGGLNQGVTGLPLKGWPLTGIDNLRPSMGLQVQKPNMPNQNQFYLASQQQQALAHAQAQGNLGASPNYGLVGLPRGNLSMKDGQTGRNDGSVSSPGQMNSPKMKMPQIQQSTSQQQDQLQQQQSNRKRKQHSSSGPANSTGTGNTVGPSPSSPASTHTPGDGIATASSLQHVNSVPKSMMVYGSEGTGGLTSSTNQMDDIEHFGDVSLEDNVESFLQHDGGDAREHYGTIKQTVTEHKTESSKGFSFGEVGCIRTRKKVLCCHFSSDGKLLASAGHDKKAVLWNMDTLQTESTPEEHQLLITDVRFRPNSTQFGTASYDKSVRIWDAANPSYCLHAHTRHTSHVISLDFHPKKNDLFCFCDSNNEIRYWNMNPFQCTRVSKQGGSAQVRFQPVSGQLLAAASDKMVSIFDVETDRQTHSFQAHMGLVNYLCWDLNGEYLASVSEDIVRVWSVASGECIHELSSNGNLFYSCVFHPSYSALLVIGGMQSLELWNMAENKSMTVPAHDDIIAALAQSPATGMVASAGHDSSVKLWK